MKVKSTSRASGSMLGSTVKLTAWPLTPSSLEGRHHSWRPPRRHSPLLVTVTSFVPSSAAPDASKASVSTDSVSVSEGTGASAPLSSLHPVQARAAANIQNIFFIMLRFFSC